MKIFEITHGSLNIYSLFQTIQSRLKRLVKRWSTAVFLMFALSLTACGGGGGGGATTTQQPNSNWDQMTWGQDNWS